MRGLARWAVLAAAAAMVVVGVLCQEHLDVYDKAVRVCLECVGIG